MNAAMQRIRFPFYRLLSLVLACLLLAWVGTASAEEAYDSATELVERAQVCEFGQSGDGLADPENCPAVISDFVEQPLLRPENRPRGVLSGFRSLLPLPTSPPPRQS